MWYADDSAIFETDIHRLRWLIGELTKLLADIGLRVNVRKTKLMATAGHKESLEDLKRFTYGIEVNSPLIVCGEAVQVVSEFPYLGTMLNSRGNWESAWSKAHKKASHKFHEARLGGIFNGSRTLEEMVIFAKAKIWSHLDGIMAIAGAGGCKTSAFHNIADDCIHNVLKQWCYTGL